MNESDDSIFGPTSVSRWLYAISKAADECLALAYKLRGEASIIVARLFTPPPATDGAYGMVLPRFVSQGVGE